MNKDVYYFLYFKYINTIIKYRLETIFLNKNCITFNHVRMSNRRIMIQFLFTYTLELYPSPLK